MSRYIDADALMTRLTPEDFGTPDERWLPERDIARLIQMEPTIDLIKHGEWIITEDDYKSCDNCYYENFDPFAYPCAMCIRGYERKELWQAKRQGNGYVEDRGEQKWLEREGEF